MWVWQSQAPAGTSKFTAVDGWAALARTVRLFMVTPAAIEASIILRRVSISVLPAFALLIVCVRSCARDYRDKPVAGRVTRPPLSFSKACGLSNHKGR